MNIYTKVAETRESFFENRDSSVKPSTMTWGTFWRYFGGAFEHAPDIARPLFDQGLTEIHDSADGLHEGFCLLFRSATEEQKRQVLNRLPDLAGKLTRAGELSNNSTKEQKSAGLDRLSKQEFERFTELNSRYRGRFGFPFIMAVKDRDKDEIRAALEARVNNSTDQELQVACNWVERIILLRLQDLFKKT